MNNNISIDEAKAWLHGITVEPILLWDIGSREIFAKNQLRMLQESSDYLILFGIEFISVLDFYKYREKCKKIIIYEKSESYLAAYTTRRGGVSGSAPLVPPMPRALRLAPSAMGGNNIVILSGNLGIIDPSKIALKYTKLFYFSEVGAAIIKIYDQLASHCQSVQILQGELTAWEHYYYQLFHQGLQLAMQAWQQQQNLSKQHLQKKNISPLSARKILHLKSVPNENLSWIGATFADFKICEYVFKWDANSIFNQIEGRPFELDQQRDIYQKDLDQLAQVLIAEQPDYILFGNFAPFHTFESYLFVYKLLEKFQIPIRPFFMDFYNLMYLGFLGGGPYHFLIHYGNPANIKLFHSDPVVAKLYGPQTMSTSFYSFNHTYQLTGHIAPAMQSSDMLYDISIIHLARMTPETPGFGLLFEHFQILAKQFDVFDGKELYKYWFHFKNFMKKNGLNSLFLDQVLNSIDWFFYSMLRIERVKQIYFQLKEQFNIKVFGDYWEAWLPSEACGGNLVREQLHEIYHHSLVTLDVSITNTKVSPHVNVLESLCSGGLTLIMDTIYEEGSEDLKWAKPFLNEESFLYFQDIEQLQKLVKNFKNDFNSRNAYIQQSQKNILSAIANQGYDDKFPDIEKNVIQTRYDDPKMKMQQMDLAQLQECFEISLGYVYSLIGYPQKALAIWEKNKKGK